MLTRFCCTCGCQLILLSTQNGKPIEYSQRQGVVTVPASLDPGTTEGFSNRQKPVDPTRPATTLKSAWQAVKRHLKVDYRLHDARHTLATAMAVAGVPDSKRQYLMGHVDENVIRRYTHLQAEDCRADLEKALATRRNSSNVPTVSPTVSAEQPKAHLQ